MLPLESIKVSLVLPMFNEMAHAAALLDRCSVMGMKADLTLEFIVVDDGSTDSTAESARKWFLENATQQWKIIRLSRNFGHQAAYLAGLHEATGDAVVMMDADLQDPPEVIPQFVDAWQKGAKLVSAVRLSRAETGWRRWCFNLFHTMFHRLTGGIMPKNSGNFGLLDRLIVEQIKQLPERSLFLPALRNWVGYPKAEVTYHRASREVGQSKMNFRRLLNLAWDGITSFSSIPLKMVGWLGLLIAVPSFLWAAWLITQRILQTFGYFKDLEVLGFTTLAVAVLALGGVQLICLGIFGEYLTRIYTEVKGRPVFIVQEILGTSAKNPPDPL